MIFLFLYKFSINFNIIANLINNFIIIYNDKIAIIFILSIK